MGTRILLKFMSLTNHQFPEGNMVGVKVGEMYLNTKSDLLHSEDLTNKGNSNDYLLNNDL